MIILKIKNTGYKAVNTGYVYKYTDLNDNIIKYVGIVWSPNRTLKQRVNEHFKYDSWCKNKKWKIEYIEKNINTRTDAEYFEAHYVSLFHTDKWYNEKKSGWGISSYLPTREDWIIYDDVCTANTDDIKRLYAEKEKTTDELNELNCQIEKKKNELKMLTNINSVNIKDNSNKKNIKRYYSVEEMLDFYYYFKYNSDIRFYGSLYNDDGILLESAEYYCLDSKIICKEKGNSFEDKYDVEKLLVNYPSKFLPPFHSGFASSIYGLKTNGNISFIDTILNIIKIDKLLDQKKELVDCITVYEKMKDFECNKIDYNKFYNVLTMIPNCKMNYFIFSLDDKECNHKEFRFVKNKKDHFNVNKFYFDNNGKLVDSKIFSNCTYNIKFRYIRNLQEKKIELEKIENKIRNIKNTTLKGVG